MRCSDCINFLDCSAKGVQPDGVTCIFPESKFTPKNSERICATCEAWELPMCYNGYNPAAQLRRFGTCEIDGRKMRDDAKNCMVWRVKCLTE